MNDWSYDVVCPHGQPGDVIWVKETFLGWYNSKDNSFSHVAAFRADGYELEPGEHWRPSIFMPRKGSRILLEIVSVRVERLNEITEADAKAEGISEPSDRMDSETRRNYDVVMAHDWGNGPTGHYRTGYRLLWDSLNAKRGFGWDKNPWVWVIEFKLIEHPTTT